VPHAALPCRSACPSPSNRCGARRATGDHAHPSPRSVRPGCGRGRPRSQARLVNPGPGDALVPERRRRLIEPATTGLGRNRVVAASMRARSGARRATENRANLSPQSARPGCGRGRPRSQARLANPGSEDTLVPERYRRLIEPATTGLGRNRVVAASMRARSGARRATENRANLSPQSARPGCGRGRPRSQARLAAPGPGDALVPERCRRLIEPATSSTPPISDHSAFSLLHSACS
jgi:hypothetical protein